MGAVLGGAWWVSATFLKAYLESSRNAPYLPPNPSDLHVLMEAELLRNAVYELGYELNNRPDWVKNPAPGHPGIDGAGGQAMKRRTDIPKRQGGRGSGDRAGPACFDLRSSFGFMDARAGGAKPAADDGRNRAQAGGLRPLHEFHPRRASLNRVARAARPKVSGSRPWGARVGAYC